MGENELLRNDDEVEINLGELFILLKNNLRMIIISVLVCTTVSAALTVFVISKKYESTARLFLKPEVTEGIADYTQITSNDKMVNNYIGMLKGNTIQKKAAKMVNLEKEEMKNTLTIASETNTQIITITAKTKDPVQSKDIVDAMVETFTTQAKETLNVTNITVVDEAEIATSPVSPSLKMNLIIGAMLGAFMSVGFLFIKFMLDTRIHNKEEAEKYLGIPSLGSIPYFED